MASAFTTLAIRLTAQPLSGHPRWASRAIRTVVFCLLFSIIFLKEYFQASAEQVATLLYTKAFSDFRTIDLLILVLGIVHVIALCCSRERVIRFPRSVLLPGVGFLCAIGLSVIYGAMRGGINLFFDWRALALGCGLYFVWIFWIQTPAELESAVWIFLLYMGIRVCAVYLPYLRGNGELLQGIRIPVYDGPTISVFVFAALLGFTCHEHARTRRRRIWTLGVATASCLLVILCFRRTYWAELILGAGALVLLSRRKKLSTVTTIAAAIALGAVVLGPAFSMRLQSFNPAQTSSQFSEDNADHVDDVLDAWDQLQKSPVLGVGVGTSYPTWRIKNWKTESVMVHNAPIHVWLKYGVFGLICYLWFHGSLFLWLRRQAAASAGILSAFLVATLAFLTAQFVVSLTFAPWPFSELQSTTLISFLIAGATVSRRSALATA